MNRTLEFQFPGRLLPVLPPKNPLTKINLNSDEFLSTRVTALRLYIDKVSKNPEMRVSNGVFHFVFRKKKKYALYLKDSKEKLIDVQETSVVGKVTDFVSDIFNKQK